MGETEREGVEKQGVGSRSLPETYIWIEFWHSTVGVSFLMCWCGGLLVFRCVAVTDSDR